MNFYTFIASLFCINVRLLMFFLIHFLLMIDLDDDYGDSVDCTKFIYHSSCRGYGMKRSG